MFFCLSCSNFPILPYLNYCYLQEEGDIHNVTVSSVCPMSKGCGMSVLVGTGDSIWSGLYVISSTVGFVISLGILYIFYINPCSISTWWYKGLLFFGCMLASVVIFGGLVVGLWHLWEKKISAREEYEENRLKPGMVQHNEDAVNLFQKNHTSITTIQYGSRPDFKGMIPCNARFCLACVTQ